jgi:3-deoxy-manno-octulosonate cytidylyltransferase (CMP-KDO synthetase)
MSERIVAIVPARMASSRFPGKPLIPLLGIPMVEHVRRRAALREAGVDDVIVATCDVSIRDAVVAAGGTAVMTADTHERCTDRIEEASRGIDAGIVVMVQGDEPLLLPDAVKQIAAPLVADPDVVCTNLLSPLESDDDRRNPDIVKAACALNGDIMYFSRAPIPLFRSRVDVPVFRQTGIMAFRADLLRRYASLHETPLERAESVDMFRLIEHGIPIRGVRVDYRTVGVDRPEDVPAVERMLQEDARQRALYERTKNRTVNREP